MDLDMATMGGSSQMRSAKSVKNRMACKGCRKLKVRCDFIESLGTASCVRCIKLNRECVADLAPPPKREKPGSKSGANTDNRIEQLEEALLETQNTIKNMRPYQPTDAAQFTSLPSPPSAFPNLTTDNFSFESGSNNPFMPTPPSSSSQSPLQNQNSFEVLVASGLLTLQQMRGLYEHFMTVLLPNCPHLVLENKSFDQLRSEHPLKLHAIISSAANTLVGYGGLSLEAGVRAHLADRLFVAVDTDVAVIESIFIFLMWSSPTLSRNHIALGLMLFHITHSMCVFSKSQEEKSEDIQIDRLYLNTYCALGGTSPALRNTPVITWSASLQKANDKVLANLDDKVGYPLTLSALMIRLEQDIYYAFEFQEANVHPSTVNSIVDMFHSQIEQLRGHLSRKFPVQVANYFTLKFVLQDHAVRFLPNDGVTNAVAVKSAINALHSSLDFFMSCRDVLNTLPTFFCYLPIRAMVSLFKYAAVVTLPVNVSVDPDLYLKRLQECLSTVPQTGSIALASETANILGDRFCNNNEFPLAKLWKPDVIHSTSQHAKNDWANFLKLTEVPQYSDDFLADIGL